MFGAVVDPPGAGEMVGELLVAVPPALAQHGDARARQLRRGRRQARPEALFDPDGLDRIEGDPNAVVGDPEDLVHVDWSVCWRP
ncbi:MAG: hypothetical protein ACRDU8_04610 [Egibacteraceae bacterium]